MARHASLFTELELRTPNLTMIPTAPCARQTHKEGLILTLTLALTLTLPPLNLGQTLILTLTLIAVRHTSKESVQPLRGVSKGRERWSGP